MLFFIKNRRSNQSQKSSFSMSFSTIKINSFDRFFKRKKYNQMKTTNYRKNNENDLHKKKQKSNEKNEIV